MTKPKFINGWTPESAAQHIIENFKGQAVDGNGDCKYFTEDGKRCAVGLFLPVDASEETKEEYNNTGGVDGLLHHYPELQDRMPLEFEDLKKLQGVHDHRYSMKPNSPHNRSDRLILNDMIHFLKTGDATYSKPGDPEIMKGKYV